VRDAEFGGLKLPSLWALDCDYVDIAFVKSSSKKGQQHKRRIKISPFTISKIKLLQECRVLQPQTNY